MKANLTRAQKEAQDYIEYHNIDSLVSQMLNHLVLAAHEDPVIYMIKYLATLRKPDSLARHGIKILGDLPNPKPINRFPSFPPENISLLAKHLTPDIWQELAGKKTQLAGELFQWVRAGIDNINSPIGVYTTDEEAYTLYAPLLDRIIEERHQQNQRQVNNLQPMYTRWLLGNSIFHVRVRLARSFRDMRFPPHITRQDRLTAETRAINFFDSNLKGRYYALGGLNPMDQDMLTKRKAIWTRARNPILYNTQAYNDWPDCRGVFLSSNYFIRVNDEDHIRVISFDDSGEVSKAFNRAADIARQLEDTIGPFAKHERYGYVNSSPGNIGTAMKVTVRLKSKQANFESWGASKGLKVIAHGHNMYDVETVARYGKTEHEIIEDFCCCLEEILPIQERNSVDFPEIPEES